MKNKRLTNLLFDKGTPLTLSSIADFDKLHSIYLSYLQGHFITVCNGINSYGEFNFFKDILIYLSERYKSDHYKSTTYNYLVYLYFDKLNIEQ
jgi:hypothetical protein